MPGLMVTLGLDGSGYERKWGSIVDETVSGHKRMSAGMGAMKRSAIELAGAEATKTAAIEGEAAAVAGSTVIHNTFNQTLNQTTVVVSSVSSSHTSGAAAAKKAGAATSGLNAIFGQLLVILREVARGQWARAASSFSRLIQMFGVATTTIFALIVGVGALAYALYKMWKASEDAARGVTYLANEAGRAKARLDSMTESIQDLTKAEIEYARQKRKMAEEMARATSTSAEETLENMRQEFEWQQKIANLRGQKPVDAMQAQIAQSDKELEFIRKAAADSEQKRKDAEARKEQAEHGVEPTHPEIVMGRYANGDSTASILDFIHAQGGGFSIPKSGSGSLADMQRRGLPDVFVHAMQKQPKTQETIDLEAAKKALNEAKSDVDVGKHAKEVADAAIAAKMKEMLAKNAHIAEMGDPYNDEHDRYLKSLKGHLTSDQQEDLANLAIKVGKNAEGKDITVTQGEAAKKYADSLVALVAATKKLEMVQESAGDVTSNWTEITSKAAKDQEALKKKTVENALLHKYGPDEAAAAEVKKEAAIRKKREGYLNESQRIGGYIGPAVTLVDVNKGIARDVKAIREHQHRNSQRTSGMTPHIDIMGTH